MQEKKQGESSPVKIKRRNLYYVLVSACALIGDRADGGICNAGFTCG